ncbi:MAG: putative toxin-antitoxin system toxin component, PIN family [Burkholderiales bacterium]
MRVFLDTNVLVSAFASRGLSADLLELVSLHHELLTGKEVLAEFERALRRKLRVPEARCIEAVESIASESTVVVDQAKPADCDADADDRRVLGEALAAGAEVFVTGDKALVELGSVGTMRILTPRQLWDALRQGAST